jgi:3-oxoacyl-[acyl-carrier protein] reductase
MDLGLEGSVFLITGGTGGLGRATAKVLVDEGAQVVVSSRDPRAVLTAASELRTDRTLGVPADNADPAAPERLVAAAIARFGRLDGALISVGGPPPGSFATVTDEQWRTSFESVFLGAVRIARAVAHELPLRGGSIAFVLSSSVRQPLPNLVISNGFRPGLAMFAKSMADDLGPRNIRVNGLMPGRIATARILDLESSRPPAQEAAAVADIPLGRLGTPDEFGRLAAFVLSPAASYLTGAMIPVDGGLIRAL